MISTDSITNKMIANSHALDVRHLDSLANAVRASSDWFALRHDLLGVAGFVALGACVVLAAWLHRK